MLLKGDTKVNTKNSKVDWILLYFAIINRQQRIVKLLLNKGINIKAKDKKCWTPWLFTELKKHSAVVKLLLDEGADLESWNIVSRIRMPLS